MMMFRKIGALFWSVGLIVVAAVIAVFAFAMFSAWLDPPRYHATNVETVKEGAWSFEPHPVLGTIPIPQSRGRAAAGGQAFDYYHGALSNRLEGPSEIARNTELGAQIVTVGGSQAWGHGVHGGDVISAVLGRLTGMTSINLAQPGSGTAYAAKRLELLPDLKPRVILYLFWGDHIYRNVRLCAPVDNPLCVQQISVRRGSDGQMHYRAPYYPSEPLIGKTHALMRQWYLEQYDGSGKTSYWKDVGWELIGVHERLFKWLFGPSDLTRPDQRNYVIDALDFSIGRIAAYAKERDARLIVVYVPVYSYPNRLEPLQDDLAQVLDKHGATTIDMTGKFNATRGAEPKSRGNYLFVIPGDGHLNALGHRMIAEEVFAVLDN